MKPSGLAGNMLRSVESVVFTGYVDVDSFQFGSPAVVGDDGEDDTGSDTLSADSGISALDPTARVFDRSGRGITTTSPFRDE